MVSLRAVFHRLPLKTQLELSTMGNCKSAMLHRVGSGRLPRADLSPSTIDMSGAQKKHIDISDNGSELSFDRECIGS